MPSASPKGPNKSRLRLWVAELRNPRRRQCRDALHVKLKKGQCEQCCLDVGHSVFRRETRKGRWVPDYDCGTVFLVDGESSEGIMHPTVAAWFGLDTRDPTFSGDRATCWNDHVEASFSEIADLIEKEYNL